MRSRSRAARRTRSAIALVDRGPRDQCVAGVARPEIRLDENVVDLLDQHGQLAGVLG